MCGRYALHATEKEIVSHFHLQQGFSMRSRYNIAPTQTIPIIQQWGKQMAFSRWGYLASWTKALDEKLPLGHINIRLETAAQKPTFKEAFLERRCLIPASGYFEWRTFSEKKQPYYVYVKNQPLIAFAGLWSRWFSPLGEEYLTCAVLTQEAPVFMQKWYARIPVIISPENYAIWLSKEKKESIEALLFPLEAEQLGVRAVSARMNTPRFEGKECIQAV